MITVLHEDGLHVKSETHQYLWVRSHYKENGYFCSDNDVSGDWFDITNLFDAPLYYAMITPKQALYLFRNKTVVFCGEYIMPNFGTV